MHQNVHIKPGLFERRSHASTESISLMPGASDVVTSDPADNLKLFLLQIIKTIADPAP